MLPNVTDVHHAQYISRHIHNLIYIIFIFTLNLQVTA